MLGTIVNVIGITVGALLGLLFKSKIKENLIDALLKAIGIVVFVIGIIGVVSNMVYIDGGAIRTRYELLLLIAIALGTLTGEALKLDTRLNQFGKWIEKKFNTNQFSEGFITASLIFCVGAMAIIGSVESALGEHTTLYLKAAIDAITALVLASTLGFGVIFSGITVFLYQGLITAIAWIFGDVMSTEFIQSFSMVGYVLVACIGLNFIRQEKLKLANMLPALLIIIVYHLIV
ncbi:MAG: DUF554 domain-containing protein [Bacilli bacterium]|jgi:uncharacterized membrane protein YqgA involved in biofilm formation|nr:DUF554 domain-containing protein [Bacilli bacterium]MDY0063579.1 DUF554 domain-containing protein [Bacilli bacterium]